VFTHKKPTLFNRFIFQELFNMHSSNMNVEQSCIGIVLIIQTFSSIQPHSQGQTVKRQGMKEKK